MGRCAGKGSIQRGGTAGLSAPSAGHPLTHKVLPQAAD